MTVIVGILGYLALYSQDVALGVEPGLRDNREYFAAGGLFFANTDSWRMSYVKRERDPVQRVSSFRRICGGSWMATRLGFSDDFGLGREQTFRVVISVRGRTNLFFELLPIRTSAISMVFIFVSFCGVSGLEKRGSLPSLHSGLRRFARWRA